MSARCLHCEISMELMPHFADRPAIENVQKLCEVIADIASSAPDEQRDLFCARAQNILAGILFDVVHGLYKPDAIPEALPPVVPQ